MSRNGSNEEAVSDLLKARRDPVIDEMLAANLPVGPVALARDETWKFVFRLGSATSPSSCAE